jgi:hypothetical protein
MPLTRKLYLLIILLVAASTVTRSCPQAAAQTVNSPSGFTSGTAACGLGPFATAGYNFTAFGDNVGGGVLSGSTIILQPSGAPGIRNPSDVVYQTPLNVQAFTTTFQFVPNAWNPAFIMENVTHNAGSGTPGGFTLAQSFNGGAGTCTGSAYMIANTNGSSWSCH